MLISEKLYLLEKYCTAEQLTQRERIEKIREFGSIEAFADHLPEEIDFSARDAKIMERLQAFDTRLIGIDDPAYPALLREISNPPAWLYLRTAMTDTELMTVQPETHCLSIVGTRRPTPYGLQVTERLLQRLRDREVTVVSGLALGIDSAAHRQALTEDIPTWAFLPCGIDRIYPTRHAGLADNITRSKRGMIWSEFAPGSPPRRQHFPARNRLISGVSAHTVVVEAGARSGSAITAGFAADQGREVWAVPGSVYMRMSAGCLDLIRDGARVLTDAEELCENFPYRQTPRENDFTGDRSRLPSETTVKVTEREILSYIGAAEPDSDRLIRLLKRSDIDAYRFLADRQMDGTIERRFGRWYLRKPLD